MYAWLFATLVPDGYSYGGFSQRCKDASTIDGRRMKQPIARDGISAALHGEKLHSQNAARLGERVNASLP